VAKDAAKTQRLNSLPQFHVLWVIRIESAPARTGRTRGACPRRMAVLAGTGRRWSASDHSRKGEGLRILVEQSNDTDRQNVASQTAWLSTAMAFCWPTTAGCSR